jgi:hypothetical protein
MFISVGWNCTPRGYIKNNLSLSKQGGYLSCPFDLCVSPLKSVISAIEDDFASFFELSLLEDQQNADGDRSQAGPGTRNITNAYGFIFNHEGSTHSHLFANGKNDDDFYIRDDFAQFRTRYTARIANFRAAMRLPAVTLVSHGHSESERANLLRCFRHAYPATEFTLLAV